MNGEGSVNTLFFLFLFNETHGWIHQTVRQVSRGVEGRFLGEGHEACARYVLTILHTFPLSLLTGFPLSSPPLFPSIYLLAATEFTQGQKHYAKFQHPSDLGGPQPSEHWKVTLRFNFLEQNNDKLALQLTEPGRMGLLRLKVIDPGQWTLTSLDWELDVSFSFISPFFPLARALTEHFLQVSPAISTVDSKNMLTHWSWSLVKNLAEERNLGVSLETLNLPAKWGEVVKGTVRFFPLVPHFPLAQQMIASTASSCFRVS
jgi:hypothetical protein